MLQPCGLQLAFGLDTYDLQILIVNYNRITRVNENELQAQEVTSVESQPPTAPHVIRRSAHKIKLPPTEVPKLGVKLLSLRIFMTHSRA